MNVALIALKLLPLVFSWIRMAESALPQKSAGSSKLAMVLETAGHYLSMVPALAGRAEEIKAQLVPHIGTAVSLLNMFGWGKTAAAVQQAADLGGRVVDTLSAATAAAAADSAALPASAAPAVVADAPAVVEQPRTHWDAPAVVG